MPGPHAHHDSPSRNTGLLTFLAGIAMLALVFGLAYHLFTQPVPGLNLSNPPQGVPPPAANIGVALSAFFVKLLLLALLTIVGSLVASKGLHLVLAAGQSPQADPTAGKNGTGTVPAVTPASSASPTPSVPPPPQ